MLRTAVRWASAMALLCSSSAWASKPRASILELVRSTWEHEVGNGGDAVVCDDGRVLMLDLYEGATRYGFTYDWLSNAASPLENVEQVLSHWRAIDPILVDRFSQEASAFFQNANFLSDVVLTDIPDSQHIAIPNGCAIKQIAIRREPSFPREKRYTVSQDLWDAMDSANRAGLILHELIYNWAVTQGHENSINARYLSAFLASTDYSTISPKEYIDTFLAVKLPASKQYCVDGVSILNLDFYPNGFVKTGEVASSQSYVVDSSTTVALTERSVATFNSRGQLNYAYIAPTDVVLADGTTALMSEILIDDARDVVGGRSPQIRRYPIFDSCFIDWEYNFEIFPSGATRRLWLPSGGRLSDICFPDPLGPTKRFQAQVGYDGFEASFHENGIPDQVRINRRDLSLNVQNQASVPVLEFVSFHENGGVKRTKLRTAMEMKTEGGVVKLFAANSEVEFNDNGYLVETP